MNTKVVIGAVVALLVIGFPVVQYMVPSTMDVTIVDTTEKRISSSTVDQYRIQTMRVDNGKPLVFRNEDAIIFPPYFKWNSADVQAQAASYTKLDTPPVVRVKYYGWRIQLFSMFPNATSIEEVMTSPYQGETSAPGQPLPTQ